MILQGFARNPAFGLIFLVAALSACDHDAGPQTGAPPSAPVTAAPALPEASPAAVAQLIRPGAPAAGAVEPAPAPPVVSGAAAATPLAVVVATPRGRVEGVVRPTITFNKAVQALGAPTGAAPAEINPPLPGAWKWLGSATLEFVPGRPAPLSTAFEVRVAAGLKAQDGSSLNEDYVYRFETPTLRPIEGEPVSAWRAFPWVRPDQVFTVGFDQRPTESSLRDAVRLRSADGEVGISVVRLQTMAEKAAAEGKPVPSPSESAADRRVEVTFTPERPLQADTDYTLVFGAGLQSTEGPLPAEKELRWAFRTYGPLRIKSAGCPSWLAHCAQGPLQIEFSNPVSARALQKGLKLDPPVELNWPDDLDGTPSPTWTLGGDFKPASTYRVVINGVKDAFDQVQVSPYDGAFTTGDMDPSFDTPEGRVLLERGHRPALPMTHVNVANVEVGWARMTPTEAVPWMLDPYRKEEPSAMRWGTRGLAGRTNGVVRSPLDLNALLTGPGDGLIALVRTRHKVDKYEQSGSTLAQVTDLALHAKVSPNDITLWAWKLSDGSPAVGAQAALYDKVGKLLASAEADAEGLVKLPGVDALDVPQVDKWGSRLWDPPPVVAVVRLGDDVALLSLENEWSIAPYRFGLSSAWANSAPEAEGLVFTDRGIYRPGEKLYVKGALRERVLGKLRTPAGRVVTLKLLDPKGQMVSTSQQTLTRFGGFAAEVTLPPDGLGEYSVTVTDEASKLSWYANALVAEYRAPAFLVDVTPAAGTRYQGQKFQATVEGRYLFGAAMPGAEVEWSLLAAPGHFEPAEADGYVFGRRTAWWDETPSAEEVGRGTWTLDPQGHFAFEGGPARTEPDGPQIYTLEATVTDVDRQQVAGRASFPVHPAAFYIGVKGPAGFATAGQAFPVSVVALAAADERKVSVKDVEVKLVRKVWHTIKKHNAWGAYETISEQQDEVVGEPCRLSVSADRAGQCVFTADKAGDHRIVAEATDAAGLKTRTADELWVVGEGYAAWLQDDDNKVEMVTDKATYDVGDTVRVLVQSPFPEADAWVTVEREGLLWQKRVRLKGTATPIEIPVTEAMIPNAFVGVVLARGRVAPPGTPGDPGRPAFRVGYHEVRVVPSVKRLNVKVVPDGPEKRPGQTLTLAVEVTDFKGKGVESEVAIWAVDQGVLALTGYQTPDPMAALYRPQGLSVRQASNLVGLVAQLAYGEKGKPQGGGGGLEDEGSQVRSNFVTTPLFFGTATTGADGRTTVSGKLPDNLTTFKLMAVAIDANDRAGHGEGKVLVTKPLLARPALPRTVRVGDRFAAGVVVHAREAQGPVNIEVSAEVEGPIKGLETLSRTLTIPPDRGVEVRFAFEALALGPATAALNAGEARIRFKVTTGGDSDIVEVTLPVRSPTRLETVATYGVTDGEAIEGLAPPGGIRTDMGELTVTLAGSALTGLGDAAQQLVEYPYGCLEQQSSRLIPFAALQSLLKQQQVPWLGERKPEDVVGTAVRAIAALQRPDGGFGYWPGADHSHYWGSAWATLAVRTAADAGYASSPVQLGKASEYLKKSLDLTGPGSPGPEERALGLFVLARLGTPERGHTRTLYDQREHMALFGKALLISALQLAGEDARAKTLLDELMNASQVNAGTVRFVEANPDTYAPLFDSEVRTTAMALQALLAVDATHAYVPRVVQALLDARKTGGGYRSTQEAAWALLALADYARVREPAAPDLEASVELAGAALAAHHFDNPGEPAVVTTVPAAKLGGETALRFVAKGVGQLHYGARLRFAPNVMPTDPEDRGLVVQRWYTANDGEERVRAVTEGSLVRVHLRLATHQARNYVAFEDPLPAGLEAVDPRLRTSARQATPEDTAGSLEGHPEPSFSAFGNVEMRDDRIVLFADDLPPGVYTYTYTARATTAGTFALPPARAEAMYRPEVNGRSDGGTFWIHPQAEVTQR